MAEDPIPSPLWPADNPAVIAHVATLQSIIGRLAGNSAGCKTWCLTVVSALLGLGAALKAPHLAGFALIPLWIFALLDALYLAQERAHRRLLARLLEKVRSGTYTRVDTFETRARPVAGEILGALGSWSVLPVYLTLMLAILALEMAKLG